MLRNPAALPSPHADRSNQTQPLLFDRRAPARKWFLNRAAGDRPTNIHAVLQSPPRAPHLALLAQSRLYHLCGPATASASGYRYAEADRGSGKFLTRNPFRSSIKAQAEIDLALDVPARRLNRRSGEDLAIRYARLGSSSSAQTAPRSSREYARIAERMAHHFSEKLGPEFVRRSHHGQPRQGGRLDAEAKT